MADIFLSGGELLVLLIFLSSRIVLFIEKVSFTI